jgi:nucleoside-diphosphate-sugar epimerase
VSDEGIIHNLIILRLAPVYDRRWSLNLDRRVFAPGKLAYLRFGSGSQKMSALARPNLVDFIEFLLKRSPQNSGVNILNVCDAEAYEFNKIIRVFQKSGIRPNRPIISIPLFPVWIATRIASIFLPGKRNWLHSCYDKLASDLVFENGKMMGTGFRPVHSLETVFYVEIT